MGGLTRWKHRSGGWLAVGIVASGLIAPVAWADAILKCRSPEGEVLFSSETCPDGWALAKEHVIGTQGEPGEMPEAADAPPPASPLPSQPPTVLNRAALAARFARALGELSSLKMLSMSYMAQTGQWPTDPVELGLDPASLHSQDIASLDLAREGGFVAHLRPAFGVERKIWLSPQASLGGATLSRRCRTNVPLSSLLLSAMGGCEAE